MERIWLSSWPEGLPKSLQYPSNPLPWFLKYNALRWPDKPAIVYYGRVLTFHELDAAVDGCASALIKLGVGKGDRVSLYLENCPQYVIAFLGALRAGAIAVPTNPMLKEAELEYELNDAGAETVVALDLLYPYLERIREHTPVRNIVVTSFQDYLPSEPALPVRASMKTGKLRFPDTIDFVDLVGGRTTLPLVGIDVSQDVAVLQYTSGTTGMPKGAMLTHLNLLVNTCCSVHWFRVTDDAVHLSVLPLFHITGLVHSMSAPIYSGTTMVLLSRFDAATALQAIDKYRVSNWVGITTMNIAIINHPDLPKYDIRSLRACVSGGAPVPIGVLEKYRELTGTDLVEGYGLSETASTVANNPLERPKFGSVGTPVFGVDVKIVDLEDPTRELPIGSEGELWVKGPMVMKGYWRRQSDTAEVLQNGWLATGDIAKMDHEGYLYILGRKKELIKCSGFSVFPSEVESLLHAHPAVAMCAVVGVPDPYRGETVKAFVVLNPEYEGKVTEDDVISWAREHMAVYKCPRIVEFRRDLPRTASGKVWRRVLAEEERRRMEAED